MAGLCLRQDLRHHTLPLNRLLLLLFLVSTLSLPLALAFVLPRFSPRRTPSPWPASRVRAAHLRRLVAAQQRQPPVHQLQLCVRAARTVRRTPHGRLVVSGGRAPLRLRIMLPFMPTRLLADFGDFTVRRAISCEDAPARAGRRRSLGAQDALTRLEDRQALGWPRRC